MSTTLLPTRELDTIFASWAAEARPYRYLSVPTRVLLDLPAARQLIALGGHAIPGILDRYRQSTDLPWGFVLQRITGLKMVPDEDEYCALLHKAKWMAWGKRQRLL